VLPALQSCLGSRSKCKNRDKQLTFIVRVIGRILCTVIKKIVLLSNNANQPQVCGSVVSALLCILKVLIQLVFPFLSINT
jgi:hypothetical protein